MPEGETVQVSLGRVVYSSRGLGMEGYEAAFYGPAKHVDGDTAGSSAEQIAQVVDSTDRRVEVRHLGMVGVSTERDE